MTVFLKFKNSCLFRLANVAIMRLYVKIKRKITAALNGLRS